MSNVKASSRRSGVKASVRVLTAWHVIFPFVSALMGIGLAGCAGVAPTPASAAASPFSALTVQGPTTIRTGAQAQFLVTSSTSAMPNVSWTILSASSQNVGTITNRGTFTAAPITPSNPVFRVVASAEGYADGLLTITLATAAAQINTSNTYFIDSVNGNDLSSGTSTDKPWRTVWAVNHLTLNPGDTVLFARGGYWQEVLQVPSSGSTTAPIVFGAYGTGAAPILDGAILASNWTGSAEPGFTAYSTALSDEPYVVTVDGTALWIGVETTAALSPTQLPLDKLSPGQFVWDSSAKRVYVRLPNDDSPNQHVMEAGQAIAPVAIDGKSNITIENLQISGGNWNCVRITNQSDNVKILNNVIKNCGYAGNQAAVFVDGARQALIQGNSISYGGVAGVNVSGYNDAINDSAIISGNIIDHMGYDCVVMGPTYHGSVDDTVVENNDISYCGQVRSDSAGIDSYLPGQGLIYRYNYIHNGGTSTSYSAGFRFDDGSENESAYGNVVYLNSAGCFQLTGTDNTVYNNTCYHNNELAAYDLGELNSFVSAISGAPQSLRVFNNVVSPSIGKHAVLVGWGATGGQSFVENLYDTSDAPPTFQWSGTELNFTDWQIVARQDIGSPLPAPAGYQSPASYLFKLQSTSPAIGGGVHMDGYVRDISGVSVPSLLPDLGAYQHTTF